jgi:hypothetical protein
MKWFRRFADVRWMPGIDRFANAVRAMECWAFA